MDTYCTTHNREHQPSENRRPCGRLGCNQTTTRYDGCCLLHARCEEVAWASAEHLAALAAARELVTA